MLTEDYKIHIVTFREKRTIHIENITEDEAVSMGIVFFDKYANFIDDCVLVMQTCGYSYDKLIRTIKLKEGLKVEIS